MELEKLGAGVFTIKNYLSEKECEEYIAYSESKDYKLATINAISGPEINQEIRNNDRIIFDDEELANKLYKKAKRYLPKKTEGWKLSGLNERFRFYRYNESHYFKWHKDGTYVRNSKEESMLTFLIFLSDNFEQGYTEFAWEKVKPQTGMALVFPHRISHRAVSPIYGMKYVLRTDVMYREERIGKTY